MLTQVNSLDRVLEAVTKKVLERRTTARVWEAAAEKTLAAHHLAAYAQGAGVPVSKLTPKDHEVVEKYLQTQFDHLARFGQDLSVGRYAESPSSALNRSSMYADAAKATWWMGKTRGWDLPAWPCDGTTQCLSNCNCTWTIQELEGQGNADAYWRLGTNDHCQTCLVRAEEWAPLRIRDGEVQL